MASISLKIRLVEQNSVKMMQFPGQMSIGEVCNEIKGRLNEANSAVDHGLYFPFLKKWLLSNKTLDFFDIKSGDELEYKKKHRPLRVKLMDDSIKTALIDESAPVAEIVKSFCDKIGIVNPDEYSFILENASQDAGSNGTFKKRSKEQLNNIGEENWLNPEKSLPEQNVSDSDMVLLKKKFFFSDKNIDRNDPIQLNLVYVQTRDAIVTGKHPCSLDESILLAALQLQVQYGNHEPDKHKPGFMKLKDFIPPEYQSGKSKEMEKRIYQEHRKLQGMSDLNAKFRYVQLCRSLKTYGVTFFAVKEKAANKNKLIPILLGISRDRVMKLDPESKEILKEWPLKILRRWAPSANSFTLDFGDYADAYYSVQTTEGAQISQLIGGYIDIILKKRKETSYNGDLSEEQLAFSEESIKPAKATAINLVQNKKGTAMEVDIASAAVVVNSGDNIGSKQIIHKKQVAEYVEPSNRQTTLQILDNAFAAINTATAELNQTAIPVLIKDDPASQAWLATNIEQNKQIIAAHIEHEIASIAAILNVVALADAETIQLDTLGSSISGISASLSQITASCKALATLFDPQHEVMLNKSTKMHLNAIQAFVQSTHPFINGDAFDRNSNAKVELQSKAEKVADNTNEILSIIDEHELSEEVREYLVGLANVIHLAVDQYINSGLNSMTKDIGLHPELATYAKDVSRGSGELKDASKNLICASRVTAATGMMPSSQEQLLYSAKLVEKTYENLGKSVKTVQDALSNHYEITSDVSKMGDALIASIKNFVDFIKDPRLIKAKEETEYEQQLHSILQSTGEISSSFMDPTLVVNHAKKITASSTRLISLLKTNTHSADPEEANRLRVAAKKLADATSVMVNLAKTAAKNPTEENLSQLTAAIEDIEKQTISVGGSSALQRVAADLINSSKKAASSSTQLISACKAASLSNRDQAAQLKLNQLAKNTGELISHLAVNSKLAGKNPEDISAQYKLVSAAKQYLDPALLLSTSALDISKTVGDSTAQMQLASAIEKNSHDLAELKRNLKRVENFTDGFEFASALGAIGTVEETSRQFIHETQSGSIGTSANYSFETAQMEIVAFSTALSAGVAKIIAHGNEANSKSSGTASLESATALKTYSQAISGLVTLMPANLRAQVTLAQSTSELAQTLRSIVHAAMFLCDSNKPISDNQRDQYKQNMSDGSKRLNEIIARVSEYLPSSQTIEHTIKAVQDGLSGFEIEEGTDVPESNSNYQQVQNSLNSATSSLAVATNVLVNNNRTSNLNAVKTILSQVESDYQNLLKKAQMFAAIAPNKNAKMELFDQVKNISDSLCSILESVKGSNRQHNNSRGAAKAFSESISKLLEFCTANSPGSFECNRADQLLINASSYFGNGSVPMISNSKTGSYLECVRSISDIAGDILNTMSSIVSEARSDSTQKLGNEILSASSKITEILEHSARAIYLIGNSDPDSKPTVAGVINHAEFINSVNEIQRAMNMTLGMTCSQQEIMASATMLAKQISALCGSVKQEALNPKISAAARLQFTQCYKNLAAHSAYLVEKIKGFAISLNPEMRKHCETAFQPVSQTIDLLLNIINIPELAPPQATSSPYIQQKQASICDSCRSLIGYSRNLVATAKVVCSGNRDESSVQIITSQTKSINDGIRTITTLLIQNSPGQKELEAAIEKITATFNEIDTAVLRADVGNLRINENKRSSHSSLQKETLISNLRALSSLMIEIAKLAQNPHDLKTDHRNAVHVGVTSEQFAISFSSIISSWIQFTTLIDDSTKQKRILSALKGFGDETVAVLYFCKDAVTSLTDEPQKKITDAMVQFDKAANIVIESLEASSKGNEEVGNVIKEAERVISSVSSFTGDKTQPGLSYPIDAQKLLSNGREYTDFLNESFSRLSRLEPEAALKLSKETLAHYTSLVDQMKQVAATTSDTELRNSIVNETRDLGVHTVKLVEVIKDSINAANNNDGYLDPNDRQKVVETALEATQKTTKLLRSIKDGLKGIAACEKSRIVLQDLISGVENQLIFAEAGQLNPLDNCEQFSDLVVTLHKISKDIIDSSKQTVSSVASGDQVQLASSISTMTSNAEMLHNTAKKAATTLSSSHKKTQLQILLATKTVLGDILAFTDSVISASSKIPNQNATEEMNLLKAAARKEVGSIGDLIQCVKAAAEHLTRASNAVDTASEDIRQLIAKIPSLKTSPITSEINPEDVAVAAKKFASNSANLVSISSKTGDTNMDDIVKAVNQVKLDVSNMLQLGITVSKQAEATARKQMEDILIGSCECCIKLLGSVKSVMENPGISIKNDLQTSAKEIAQSVAKVVESITLIVPGGFVDPNDPNVIAERELLAAANSIEAAAKKLALLKPAERPKSADESLNFEEQILEAAKSIAAATSALVKSATTAQREIVEKGNSLRKHEAKVYFTDGTWSDGLVSAAKSVAIATSDLCETANAAVKGEASSEKVIAAAKAVSSSTAQLLTASSVKADLNSQAQVRLKAAGRSVTQATEQLVKSAQNSMALEAKVSEPIKNVSSSYALQRAQELDAQAKVLQMEKELEMARSRLNGLRKGKYQK